MYILYDIFLYLASLVFIPIFIVKMIKTGKYRAGNKERLGFISRKKLGPITGNRTVWFNAVSVGETKAVLPLLRAFRAQHPDIKIAFSTNTITGQEVARKEGRELIDLLFYYPFDYSWVIKRVLNQLRPQAFILVEKELWPNTIRLTKERNIPSIVVNGTISDNSFKNYRKVPFIFKDTFANIRAYCAQTEKDRRKAQALGASSVILTGNLKFDSAPPKLSEAAQEALAKELFIKIGSDIIVAGSTHKGEEELILSSFAELKKDFPSLRLILAPRHPERFDEVAALMSSMQIDFIRRSRINETNSRSPADVILLDTIGELGLIYSFATVAFVGGSLVDGTGGHNLLEPAFFSRPVIYGIHIDSCIAMAELLEKNNGALRVTGANLTKTLKDLLTDKDARTKMGAAACRAAIDGTGATDKTLDVINSLL
ncbi:3-deoxy-D-manno-octulosonic acid transferase [hydrothermal vent metagenome]|uniref:lipid IVA 3-deoxy-D-manno-octulosonic acid transferase n=1 Tax=hydrothermal vent metagenome TaxID=652676 RepID=A0A3B0VI59_9ZZZZ